MDLPVLADAATALALLKRIEGQLEERGISEFRDPPPVPTTCCGRGCNGCVWESYFAAVGWWRDDALALLSHK